MPFAVTHVISTMILVDLYRHYNKKYKKYLSLASIFVAGIAGLLPDLDLFLNSFLNFFGYSFKILEHGGLLHTPIVWLIFLIPAFVFLKRKNYTIATYFFIIVFGALFHIFLDYLLGGGGEKGLMLLWPLSSHLYKIHLLFRANIVLLLMLDALLLLGWLFHELIKGKIRDFI